MREDQADLLIQAIKDNTAAVLGKGGTTTGANTPARGTTSGSGSAAPTFEMVKAAVYKVRDEKGKPAAMKIIKEAGKADEFASIKKAQFAAVMAACKKALGEGEDDSLGGEEAAADEDTL